MCHARRIPMVNGHIRSSKRERWMAIHFLVFAGLSCGVAEAQESRDEDRPAARAEVMAQQMTQPADGSRRGGLPIVADVVGVPGDHSVRSSPEKEGLIEGKTSTQKAAAEAAGEGAGMGALHGIKHKNAKEAVEGAAEAALAAYLMEAGRGHELQLPKGAKLEIELERALYLVKE